MVTETKKEEKIITPEEQERINALKYVPTDDERKEIDYLYAQIQLMIDARNETYRQFNNRTLRGFVDDSEKRVQGFVPDRESQGKEEWQSNVFNQSTRNKLKAIVAAVANTPPSLRYKAVNLTDGGLDLRRADVTKNLVDYSRNRKNTETEIFWEAWTCATQGTVIKYDGYLKTKYKRKFIKSYDLITGDMEFEEREVTVNDECVDMLVPIQEFFIMNFRIHDVQDQPAVAWIRYLDRSTVEKEFGQFKNWEYVFDKETADRYYSETDTFFSNQWSGRVENVNEYEVIKYYNRFEDKYCVLINGVLMLSAPLLWGKVDKVYPFSKTIFEPFSGKAFFYGNSIANANMDTQDVINTLYNMSIDKTYRSLNPVRLAGLKNKDLLEQENEAMGMESTIYVEDVNQVSYEKVPGITDSEMALIKWVAQGMDLGTVDQNQQGIAGRGVTAREIVIANENAKKLKGIFFMFLTDLWIQKTKLRILNIQMNYTAPRVEEILGENGKKTYVESFRTFLVEDSEFPNGESGTLAIQFVKNRNALPTSNELDIEEEKYKMQGKNFQKIAITSDYLDNFDYDVQVISESLYQKDSAEQQAIIQEKIKTMALAFPQIFLKNQDVLFKDFAKAYGDDETKYDLEPAIPMPAMPNEAGPLTKTPGNAPKVVQTGKPAP
ncbi:MAG: hypothetical protein PHQ35_10705, partial [Phycisphaerae bacterium]|nr:hypothetical protein [Phycisphaerae bacterium]